MCPKIFGFIDSYLLMLILGIGAAFAVVFLYLKKIHMDKIAKLNVGICGCFAVVTGFIFSSLFQNLYDLIKYGSEYKWTWAITFYGGLFGGVVGFTVIGLIMRRKDKHYFLKETYTIAPGAIALAHALGRIGCFMAGCCYGKASEEHGVYFQTLGYKAIPTNLYEAIFLFVLAAILLYLAFKKNEIRCFNIYCFSYAIFRFVIEYFRGDSRGAFSQYLSPSQIWCILIFLANIPLIIYFPKIFSRRENEK